MSALLPVAPLVLLVAVVVTALAATLQGTIGFGFAVLSVPVLSLLDPHLAPVPQLLLALPLTLSMAWRERHHADLRGVGWVLAGRVPGAGLGVALLALSTPRLLDGLLASFVLIAIAMLVSRAQLRRNATTQLVAGVVSGAMSLVSSIGGPPLALLYHNDRGPTLRASLAVIFSVGCLITIAARTMAGAIHTSDVVLAVLLLPALLAGVWVSRHLVGRVEGRPLRIAILAVSAAASIGLLVRAAVG